MASGSWSYYYGNQVPYGSGGWFRAIIGVYDNGSNTTPTTDVYYRYSVQFNVSISDSNNTVSWTDPWGAGNANNTVFSYGAGGGEKVVGGPYGPAGATIQYGGGNTIPFTMSVSGLANSSGTSVASVNYPMPPRLASAPTAPGLGVNNITATSAQTYTTTLPVENGATVTKVEYIINNTSDVRVSTIEGGYGGVTHSNLTRATSYRAHNRAWNGQWGPYSNVVNFTTPPVAPTMSTSYTAGSLTRNSAIISGLSVSDNGGQAPSDVRVQYNTTASDSGAAVVTKGSWANVTLSGLAASTTYHYRCAAYNSAGWSAYPTTWKSFTTLADAPNDMAAPTFSAVTDTSMRVEWVAPSMNGATFVTYNYQVSLVDTFASTVTTGSTSALFVDLTGLIPGTRYYARVRAMATPNNGGYGTANQLTTGFAPGSGLRTYLSVGTTIHPCEIYTFVGGVRKRVRPMYAHDGLLETE